MAGYSTFTCDIMPGSTLAMEHEVAFLDPPGERM